MNEDAQYVLTVACTLFKRTYPFAKDKQGYTFPDAWLFRDLLNREASTLTEKHIEWVRRALLKYKKQIGELGFDFRRIDGDQISPVAAYWKRDMENAKILSLKFTVTNKTRIVATYRIFSQRKREKAYAELTWQQGVDLLKESDPTGHYDLQGCTLAAWTWSGSNGFVSTVCRRLGFPIITNDELEVNEN